MTTNTQPLAGISHRLYGCIALEMARWALGFESDSEEDEWVLNQVEEFIADYPEEIQDTSRFGDLPHCCDIDDAIGHWIIRRRIQAHAQ